MALATSNRAKIRYALEAIFGTPPATLSNELRITGESLAYSIKTDTSKEIRSDRQITDQILVGADASGDINFELSYKEYDKFFESALQSAWLGMNDVTGITATITLANTLTASAGTPFAGIVAGQKVRFSGWATVANNAELTVVTASPTVLTFAASALTNEDGVTVSFTSYGKTTLSVTTTLGTTLTAASGAPFANAVAGQNFLITGMPTPSNNKVVKIVSKTSSLVVVCAAGTFANESGATTTLSGSRLTNGTTERSWSIERAFEDIVQFFVYRGMSLSKMSLSFASGAIVTGMFGFLGKDAARGVVTALAASTASQAYDVTNAVSGVGNVLENGAVLAGTFIKSLKFDLDNKLRARDAIGVLGAVSIGSGACEVKGDMEIYLADGTLYDKMAANTASSLTWTVQDTALNGYAFTLPKLKYSDAKVQAGGLDQDVMLSMPFTALMDATTGKTIIIDRFGA